MELQLNKEPVFLSEVLFDGQSEQGVEFDYVLPDYYPDIFKILKCTLTPGIASYSISGTQLFIDGSVIIRVLYLADDSVNIHCIEHRYTYSKTVDITRTAEKPLVYITPKTDYVNCRAASGRRFDVRGAVSCKIRIVALKQTELISGADNLETKLVPLTYCGAKLVGGGQFVLREDIETGVGKGGITGIISCDACAQLGDIKIIAGKVVVKGDAHIKALYLVKIDEDTSDTEVMEATIPISRIIDIDGIDDSFICNVMLKVMDCSLEIKPSEQGENRLFACDVTIDCQITANKESTIPILTDVYSIDYESVFTKSSVKAEYSPQPISKQLNLKSTIECNEGALSEIFDSRCDVSNAVCRVHDENTLTITGQLTMQAAGRLSDGTPVCLEKTEPFETECDINPADDNSVIEPNLQTLSVVYSISGDNEVELRICLLLTGCLYRIKNIDVISEVVIDSERPKQRDTEYALKMYYADAGEEIFDIAKRYNTQSSAIIDENELESETLSQACMLLIPIV